MKKSDALAHWRTLKPNQPILPFMRPIPYKSVGSRYGACGIRIDGNPQFIDAVLSRIKDLLEGESNTTRLELARSEVDGRGIGKTLDNMDLNAQCVYIRLHERGHEAKMLNTMFRLIKKEK